MKKICLLLCIICLPFIGIAQQIIQEKLHKLGNTARGFGSSTITNNGKVLITGGYTTSNGGQSIFALLDAKSDTIWMRNGPKVAFGGIGVKQTPDGGYALYTAKVNMSPTTSGTALLKYNSNGLPEWTAPYAINTFDIGHLLLTASDSGYFLGGENIISGKNSSFTLGRTDSLGNLKWRKPFHWSNADFLADMQHTKNGNIIMYGGTDAPQRLKLLVVDQNGDSVLGRKLTILGGNRNERLWSTNCSVTPLSDGGFLLASEIDTSVANASPYLGMVVKVNANLQPVWYYINRSLPNNVIFTRSRELTDGSVVMLAHERKGASSTASNKFFLYQFSSIGSLLNVYTFTSTLASQIQTTTLEALPDSSFIIGGRGIVTPAPNYSSGLYVAKVKVAGLAPALPLPGPIKITSTKEELLLAEPTLGESYPNPTTFEATIPYSLPKNYSKASIMLQEIATGREIRNYAIQKNRSSLSIDVSSLSNGLYLYSLIVDDKPVATKKLAVVK